MSIMLHPIVIFVQYNIYDIFCCKCGSKEREAPPPRRAERGFPLPLWRGVNSLASCWRTNREFLTRIINVEYFKRTQIEQIVQMCLKVGRWCG